MNDYGLRDSYGHEQSDKTTHVEHPRMDLISNSHTTKDIVVLQDRPTGSYLYV